MANSLKKLRQIEKINIPKSVQEALPIKQVFEDGVFRCGNQYSKTFRFTDINYRVASKDDQTDMFLKYCDLINSLDTEAVTKLTINNRRLNRDNFEKRMLMPYKKDGLDIYRREYNGMLLTRATVNANNVVQEKYITVSTKRRNVQDARALFTRIASEMYAHFSKLSSQLIDLTLNERLRIFHDFYRLGSEQHFQFELKSTIRKGHSFKDSICPDSMTLNKDYIKVGEKYCRTLYMREYASFIKDSLITELTDLPKNMMLSIDMQPIPTDEAVNIINKLILGTETDKARFTRKQSENGNFTADIPYDLEMRSKELHEFMHDLTSRDQRMLFATVTIALMADSLDALNSDTESIKAIGRKYLCDLTTLTYQQLDGMYTALPFGLHKLPFKWRTPHHRKHRCDDAF